MILRCLGLLWPSLLPPYAGGTTSRLLTLRPVLHLASTGRLLCFLPLHSPRNMAIRLQPMSTIFHTVVLEQLKKTDLLEQLSQRNCGPQKTTPSPASVLHHVLADQQHGLTKNDTQCLAPGCESKNITKRVSHKKNTLKILTAKTKHSGRVLGRWIINSFQTGSWEAREGLTVRGEGLHEFSQAPPSFLRSWSAVLRPRSDGEKPTRENPAWKECICC